MSTGCQCSLDPQAAIVTKRTLTAYVAAWLSRVGVHTDVATPATAAHVRIAGRGQPRTRLTDRPRSSCFPPYHSPYVGGGGCS
jgi:hypothetical protein